MLDAKISMKSFAKCMEEFIAAGVPLTTKIKPNPYYFPMRFKYREQCVTLSQLRLWDGKRLTHKMGQLPDDQFEAVKQALRRLLK